MEMKQELSIWKNYNFLLLWIGGLFTSFSISIFMFSQTWYVVNVLELEAKLGILMIASSIPRILFMLVGGAIADRFPKNKIMFSSAFVRIFLIAGLIGWMLLFDINIWTFSLFALFFGILDAFFWSADSSIIPEVIHKDNLTRGNSIIQMTNQGSFIFGPVLGGVIVSYMGFIPSFIIAAGCLVISSTLIFFIRLEKKNEEDGLKKLSILKSITEGFSYVKTSSFLVALMITAIFINLFMMGPLQMGLPLFVKNHYGDNALIFSYLEGTLAGGMLVGSILVGISNIKKKRGQFAMIGLLLNAVLFAVFSFTTELWLSLIAIGFVGLTFPLINIPIISALQSFVKEDMMGRVMSIVSMSSMGLIPVSYAIVSVLLFFGINVATIMLTGALLLMALAIFILIKVKAIRNFD